MLLKIPETVVKTQDVYETDTYKETLTFKEVYWCNVYVM
jgi:hypothetical protein